VKTIKGEPDRIWASLQRGGEACAPGENDEVVAAWGQSAHFGPGLAGGEGLIVRNWWAVSPSSAEQQIEPERIRGAQEMVTRGKAVPHDIGSVGILILAVLAIVYTLYFGKEIVLPIALALVLKLLLQPAMRLLHDRLRLPGALAALLLIIAVFGAIAAVGFTISVPASGWIQKAPESLPLLKEKLAILRQPLDYLQTGLRELESMTGSTGGAESAGQTVTVKQGSGLAGSLATGTATTLSRSFTTMIILFFLLALGGSFTARFRRGVASLQGQTHSRGDRRRD
jgi:hypothetical protein